MRRSILVLVCVGACASDPSLGNSVVRATSAPLVVSDFTADSVDILQCAQRVGATGGFFPEGRNGTVLVRQTGADLVRQRGTTPVRPPVAVKDRVSGTVIETHPSTGAVRIVLTPRTRNGWARANARAPGSRAPSTRELVRLMNSRCTLRHAAD
jgi:hypothetical protein